MAEKDPDYRVMVKVGDATVEVTGAKDGVVDIVRALSEVIRAGSGAKAESVDAGEKKLSNQQRAVDIRSFFQAKTPASDVEATAVAAFYLQHVAPADERVSTINVDRLENAFVQAHWPKPTGIRYTLGNTKTAGYLDSTNERGEYKLNAVGYNLVEHSLGQTSEENVSSPARRSRRPTKAKRRPKTTAARNKK